MLRSQEDSTPPPVCGQKTLKKALMTCSRRKLILCLTGVTKEWMDEHFKPRPAVRPDIDRDAISFKVFTQPREFPVTHCLEF